MSKTYAGALCRWSLGLALVGGSAAHTAPSGSVAQKPPAIYAAINSNSYGYDLTCVINGHDVGFKGGQSESQTEFAEGAKEAEDWPPAECGAYAPLRLGRNTVKITYKRKPHNELFAWRSVWRSKGIRPRCSTRI